MTKPLSVTYGAWVMWHRLKGADCVILCTDGNPQPVKAADYPGYITLEFGDPRVFRAWEAQS